ncbi:MAG: sulfotransferase domain-containing protein, partial [Promethearchaeota archaeon]
VVKYFEQELKNVISWAESSPNVKALNLNYKDVLNNSAEEIQKINKFLGIQLDAKKMAEIIDPTLYRNKAQ